MDGLEDRIQRLVAGLDVCVLHTQGGWNNSSIRGTSRTRRSNTGFGNLGGRYLIDADHETSPLLAPGPASLAVSLLETIDDMD